MKHDSLNKLKSLKRSKERCRVGKHRFLATKAQSDRTAKGISEIVHKVGTNRLISRKTVSLSFSEPYDFIPSFLGNLNESLLANPSLQDNSEWWSTKWCPRQDLNLYDVTH